MAREVQIGADVSEYRPTRFYRVEHVADGDSSVYVKMHLGDLLVYSIALFALGAWLF